MQTLKKWRKLLIWYSGIFAIALMLGMVQGARADSPKPRGEQLNIDSLKDKLWLKGEDYEIRVIQNRLYSKTGKFHIGAFGAQISTDPFLDVRSLGAVTGIYFSETIGIEAFYWKAYASPSSALTTLEATVGNTANTNLPKSFMGGELIVAPIYGKLSLFGKKILYYDLHLLGGVGYTKTETGSYMTPSLGIGQQIHLSRYLTFRFDYRWMTYNESVLKKVNPSTPGEIAGERRSTSNVITLGLSTAFKVF